MVWILSRRVGSEVETDLAAEDQSVVDFTRAAGPEYILNIRLEKERALTEIKPISRLQNGFVVLHTHSRVELLLSFLGVAQITAEVAVNNAEAG